MEGLTATISKSYISKMNYLTPADNAFAAAVERSEAPNEGFHHRDHLRLAWIYLHRYGRTEAAVRIAETIRQFAAHHGQSGRYHETMTQAWLLLVDAAGGSSFEEALSAKPELLDQGLLRKYYSADLLASAEARARFVPPDTAALPDAR
jgi:N-formylglutamate deformylase